MKYISNLADYESELHPTLFRALSELSEGKAVGVRYDLMDKYLSMSDGSVLRVEKAYRSVVDQEMIYQNQDKTNPVTLARGGDSLHQWGLACDLVFRVPGWDTAFINGVAQAMSSPATWKMLGMDYWYKSKGLSWGGLWSRPVDPGHVELEIPHPADTALCGSSWWAPVVVEPKGKPVSKWILLLIAAVVGFVVWKMTRPVISGSNVRLASSIGPRRTA
ncbi:MAG TPA: M15 family metallopeptidase [Rectinemataceae bacterium]|nr:M15 family metallopeptidase [Rectinemataceae bacterium]